MTKLELILTKPLRAALWWAVSKRGFRTWILPAEYNLRTPKPWLTGSGMAVKIVHGRVRGKTQAPSCLFER